MDRRRRPVQTARLRWEDEEQKGSDGLSLYRALARHLSGDPLKYLDTMNAVLDLYLRIWANPLHPLHEAVRRYTIAYGSVDLFFNALSCPDAALSVDYPHVLGFIADALNIRLHVYYGNGADRSPRTTAYGAAYGRSQTPIRHVHIDRAVLHGPAGTTYQRCHFNSLVVQESGRNLITFLETSMKEMDDERRDGKRPSKYNGLQMKQICWWWKTEKNEEEFHERTDGAYHQVWCSIESSYFLSNNLQIQSPKFLLRWYNGWEKVCYFCVNNMANKLLTLALGCTSGPETRKCPRLSLCVHGLCFNTRPNSARTTTAYRSAGESTWPRTSAHSQFGPGSTSPVTEVCRN